MRKFFIGGIVVFLLAQLADVVTTLIGLSSYRVLEANPAMVFAGLAHSLVAMCVYKAVITGVCLVIMWHIWRISDRPRRQLVLLGLYSSILVVSAVVLHNVLVLQAL